MKVLLLKDVQSLGSAGDIRDVADGYARNFLIPGGYVKVATEAALEEAEALKAKKARQAEEELKVAEELARKLQGVSVLIAAKADKSGKLYAAIKPEEISKALKEKGLEISENKIIIKDPIKEVGECEIIVNLDHGLEVSVAVMVETLETKSK